MMIEFDAPIELTGADDILGFPKLNSPPYWKN
jgi:hypothetical protein